MSSSRLSNYLRSNRKRLGLTQEEVGYLLGSQSGAKVCRYERFVRDPNLETALAFQAIFKRPISELFKGLYEETANKVATRAKLLSFQTHLQKTDKQTIRKKEVLKAIPNWEAKNSANK